MTSGWPSLSVRNGPSKRARMSGDPPGANGTIKRTGRVGYAWAARHKTGSDTAPVARDNTRRRESFIAASVRKAGADATRLQLGSSLQTNSTLRPIHNFSTIYTVLA